MHISSLLRRVNEYLENTPRHLMTEQELRSIIIKCPLFVLDGNMVYLVDT